MVQVAARTYTDAKTPPRPPRRFSRCRPITLRAASPPSSPPALAVAHFSYALCRFVFSLLFLRCALCSALVRLCDIR